MSAISAQGLTATFNTAADIPVTVTSYAAAGEAAFTLGFAPTPGTNLTVIKNTGLPFIDGQFSNLANGATVNLAYDGKSYPFVAWYYGGEGHNDLVLLWPYTGLAAWGLNNFGQLGDGSTTNSATPLSVWQRGAMLGKTIVQAAHGASHSLALCSDGAILYWGREGESRFSNPSLPKALEMVAGTGALSGKTVIAISAGSGHNLALCSDGSVATWGSNDYGQLGNNSTTRSHTPVAVNIANGTSALHGKTVVAIAAGNGHSLALCSDGMVAAWGLNSGGQLGNNSQTNSPVPVAVNIANGMSALYSKTVVSISAGDGHNLALCSDGSLVAWGWNSQGQIGDSSLTPRHVPVAVSMTDGMSALSDKTVVSAVAGAFHSLALCSDGTLTAWGDNQYGQLGDDSTVDRPVPAAVNMVDETSALSGRVVTALAAGELHSLAYCSDGALAAWGRNAQGQIGDNTTAQRNVPVAVNALDGQSVLFGKQVIGMSAGSAASHTMVIHGEAAASKIVVTGDGFDISHGSETPDHRNLTHFGDVQIFNARQTNRFTISSTGNIPLHLTGTPLVTLGGPDAAAFEVIKTPADTVPTGGLSVFDISFDPAMPGQHDATVTIQSDAVNHPGFTFTITGFGALGTKLPQAISFAPPSTVFTGQSPLNLEASSSSGLPVTLFVYAGTTAPGAAMVGNTLSFTGTGVVKVLALAAGDTFFSASPRVVKTITVKASPAGLTLLNLAQTYTGTPREIGTLGGSGTVMIEYKIGTAFGTTAPTDTGKYSVRATDDKGVRTGTLIIAKAPLYVIPDDKSKFVGQDNPPLTLDYIGWVNGESADLVVTAPILKTTAAKTSVGGVYPITVSRGAAPANYAFIYKQGALVVDSFATSYEALLQGGGGELVGRLSIIIAAANTSFSGKLHSINEKAALPLKGTLSPHPGTKSAQGSAMVTSNGIPYTVTITAQIDGSLIASVTRDGSSYANSSAGRRLLTLAAGKTAPFAGAHTAVLEPATPAAADVPAGAGWAAAAISTKGVMTLAGRLGDGTSFTTTLMPDDASDPTYRLFLQPYKTGAATRLQSHFGGSFTLTPHPALAGRRHVEAAVMTWVKPGLPTDESYRSGFGVMNPVSSVLMLDPWLPPAAAKRGAPAIPLASRLGLTSSSFEVLHANTGSTLNDNLPTRAGLSSTNAVTVTAPAANTTKWKATLVPATGLFSGSFELADTTPKPRVVTFSGVLRQPTTPPDALIGDGHYLLPPLTGTEKTTGEIMFLRP